ncbi:fibrillarin-like rRNA/tRNA 2'-O-methyltransferase [Candidatus Woesearchaeota archaeon]|nr:fibrillarin-like rRNA/tRNA 2'-O-methyltransferase [Candidatus Woesearchaeota archaeon]
MSQRIKPHKVFEIFHDEKGRRLYTQNMLPGKTPFNEKVVREQGKEYREFDPTRSKLAAAIVKGATNIGIRGGDVVLYLGASHGYTISYISDMVGKEGLLFGIDSAPRVLRDLVFLAEERRNIIPILANANHPEEYEKRICGVDVVYQDIAQRNQAEIFVENCRFFLKEGGYGLLAVKARSIDARRKSKQIFEEVRKKVEKELTVIDYRILEPLEKDHCMIIVKKP